MVRNRLARIGAGLSFRYAIASVMSGAGDIGLKTTAGTDMDSATRLLMKAMGPPRLTASIA